MKKFIQSGYAIFLSLLLSNIAHSQTGLYNIDLKNDQTVYTGKGILGSLSDNKWNNIRNINTANNPLVNSQGATSNLKFSSSKINGTFGYVFPFGLGEFSDYWVLQNNNTGNITIENIVANEPYELVLFCFGPADGRPMKASVNGGTAKQTSGKGGAIEWAATPGPESNFMYFSGIVPANGILSIDLTCINSEADIEGLQLQVGTSKVPPKGVRTYQLGADLKAGYDVNTMYIGTSLTDLPYGQSWPTELYMKLWNKYQGRELLSNRAISSTNSGSGKANIDGWVASDNPDVVFIEYGINDATGLAYDVVKSNLDYILSSILTNNPNADIIFQTMNNCTGNNLTARPKLAEYYQLYRDYAAFRGYHLIDNYPIWKNLYDSNPTLWNTYVPDGIHPNSVGRKATVIDNMASGVENAKPRAAKPKFATMDGKISISTETANAKIYYTTDGKVPTPNSMLYSAPFAASSSTKIKTIAVHPDFTTSVIAMSTDVITSNETEIVRDKNYSIYPNPAKNAILIKSNTDEIMSYEILSTDGKILQEGIVNNSIISIEYLKSGIYLIKLKGNHGEKMNRFLKE